ncbi:MAG: NADP-dependent oxidoreductase [Proteobacteria bacterium]|jgi:hypothetical protein|nr:NADP-dependent oxidoreductase [Pseudomonadota bacterium]
MLKNRRFLLASRPTGKVVLENFKFVTEDLAAPKVGEVLVRNQYLSVDPTNRIWMTDADQYMPPIALGEVIRAGGIGVVLESNAPGFAKGDLVNGLLGWQDYALQPAQALQKLPTGLDVPVTAFLSVLGMTGCTAYFGLLDVVNPRAGETLVVSGAAGAVGSIVGQIGLIAGLRVIGIAGGPAKCRWLTEDLGFHGAIDYKSEDVEASLRRLCPSGIDVYFDNVGGPISDAVFSRMNNHGRVSLCGLISGYNSQEPLAAPRNYAQILMKRLNVRGFIILDYMGPRWGQAVQSMYGWVKAGKIKYAVDVEHGLENAPAVLNKLFDGSNTGKLLLQIS